MYVSKALSSLKQQRDTFDFLLMNISDLFIKRKHVIYRKAIKFRITYLICEHNQQNSFLEIIPDDFRAVAAF